jgi:hypothetical protein
MNMNNGVVVVAHQLCMALPADALPSLVRVRSVGVFVLNILRADYWLDVLEILRPFN